MAVPEDGLLLGRGILTAALPGGCRTGSGPTPDLRWSPKGATHRTLLHQPTKSARHAGDETLTLEREGGWAGGSNTLVERINLAHGLAWNAVHGRAPGAVKLDDADILISCIDTASAHLALDAELANSSGKRAYWNGFGNSATNGQFIIGCPASGSSEDHRCLPTVLDYFPEFADEALPDDNSPSCSVAEALERQSLFMNRVLASHARALLFDLIGRGSIGHAGAFINLDSGQSVPVALGTDG